ncbi:PID-CTERM protein-sorting domain-containing protein [Pedobacter sp.]|uniref:PID-CTERM protein-sorting domain-containing protein n=1 Tax=Pedobacter sp. TaxID=1411316 RepID=UPI00396CE04D
MKSIYKKIVYVFLGLLVLTTTVHAQGFPCPDPDEPCDPDDVNVPFDGGASLLIAAGVAYGLKKINDKRKEESQTTEKV